MGKKEEQPHQHNHDNGGGADMISGVTAKVGAGSFIAGMSSLIRCAVFNDESTMLIDSHSLKTIRLFVVACISVFFFVIIGSFLFYKITSCSKVTSICYNAHNLVLTRRNNLKKKK
jgi:hypothetical protein